ncbi:MAG: NmrA family NAD(P)-binding protein [Candidatus Krumholzibacteriia bacterium]
MKIAVNTPNGNIGRPLTTHLLDAGAELILLTRSPQKVAPFAERGAVVREGNLEDEGFVIEATRGADVLFWLTVGDYSVDDLRSYQNLMGRNAAAAVIANKIPRVVDLSSIGAQHKSGTGPIAGLHDVEKLLEKTGAHVTHLRPGFFMENFFAQAAPIASEGAVFLPLPGNTSLAMIATADIARHAAERLLDASWTGRSVIELVGPEEVTFENAARTIGRAIGREVRHVEVSEDQSREAIEAMGMSTGVANLMNEMHGAFAAGKVVPEGPKPVVAATTLDRFAEKVFRPGFKEMTR